MVKSKEQTRITKKMFREFLNKECENRTNESLAKGKNNRYKPRTRKYGDYLYAQDRDMFDKDFEEWKKEIKSK